MECLLLENSKNYFLMEIRIANSSNANDILVFLLRENIGKEPNMIRSALMGKVKC